MLRILLIIEQCNPEWASVPLVGYNFYSELRKLTDVKLVTHERNRSALEKVRGDYDIDYIPESYLLKKYYTLIKPFSYIGGWALMHALSYPIYSSFNRSVFRNYSKEVKNNKYDIVHAITPILPRYPVKIINACKNTPFILGPVNGGLPFPKGFNQQARKEFAYFNFLRFFSKYLPGYANTYKNADKILAGSMYTLNMLQKLFSINNKRIELFHENGIKNKFINKKSKRKEITDKLNLLFVGRLVPYKGADMAIESLTYLDESMRDRVHLTIVGDGSERKKLEKQISELGLQNMVTFTGWIEQEKTLFYYQNADIFYFPSIREFGGAVALEAMAAGLPCIVPDYGGLGEYVTDEVGFKFFPESREQLIKQFAEKLVYFLKNPYVLRKMSEKSLERAKEYKWENKAHNMVKLYNEVKLKFKKSESNT